MLDTLHKVLVNEDKNYHICHGLNIKKIIIYYI